MENGGVDGTKVRADSSKRAAMSGGIRHAILAALLMATACALPAVAQSDETAKYFHVFPQIADGGGWQSVLLVTNVSVLSSVCTMELYGLTVDRFEDGSGGVALGPTTARIDLGGAGGYLVWPTKNESSLASGYATLRCSNPVVAQVLYASRDGSDATTGMATVFSSQAGLGFQLPVLTREARLGIAIANDTQTDASCRVVLESPERQHQGEDTLSVPSKSNVAKFLYELVPIPDGFTQGSTTVSCDQQVSVIGLQFDGAIFTSLPPAIVDLSPHSSDPTAKGFHVFPQIADGGGWQSSLLVTNVSQSTSLCTLESHGLTADRFEEASGVTAVGQTAMFSLIAPAGYRVLPTRNESALATGYATLDCTEPVVAQVLYAFRDGSGATTGMATVFSSQAGGGFQFPVLTTKVRLGIAIANDTQTDASCRVVLESPERHYLSDARLSVASKSNVARFLSELIPIPDGFVQGSATVSCDRRVSVIGLQFDGAVFTSLPPAVLDTSPQPNSSGEAQDRAALEAFYDATDGPNWKNRIGWKTAAPLNRWQGVATDAAGRVIVLSHRVIGLSGAIPAELGNLTNLKRLSLPGNELSGAIPAELGNLTNLEVLELQGNELSGTIPSELGNLTNLEDLYLEGNELSGAIPAALGNLTKVERLWLNDNNLSEAIPAALGNLTRVERLSLNDNNLSGAIPPELGNLSRLRWLNLSDNQLSGGIPHELGGLRLGGYYAGNDLRTGHLDLSSNQLTGELPASLGLMAYVGLLQIYDNQLSGTLPASLTDLQHLSDFRFYDNAGLCAPPNASFRAWLDGMATRSGPTCRNPFVTVNRPPEVVETIPAQTLAVRGSTAFVAVGRYFRDPEEEPLIYAVESSNPAVVAAIALFDDTGFPPIDWWVQLDPVAPGTATVTITARDTEGQTILQTTAVTVKPEPHGLPEERAALEAFYDATGGPNWARNTNWKTAAALGRWDGVTTDVEGRVVRLNLHNHKLSGAIPPELGNLTHLVRLVLDYNELRGAIPPELGNLSQLRALTLDHNELSGAIPPELGNLSQLRALILNDNELSGTIPPELGNLTSLEYMYLNSNQLTGELPASLTNLRQLRVFWFGGNAGLCMPATEGFQDWMNEIENRWPRSYPFWGATCSP